MGSRQLVGAVSADHEHRLSLHQRRERDEHLQGTFLRPLQIIKQHSGRPLTARRHEGRREALQHRRVLGMRHIRQLGKPCVRVRSAAIVPSMGTQHGHQRAVRRGAGPSRRRFKHLQTRLPKREPGEHGLAHPGIAGQQHQRPATRPRLLRRLLQHRELPIAADERLSHRIPTGCEIEHKIVVRCLGSTG
jgi:hypothetical protein